MPFASIRFMQNKDTNEESVAKNTQIYEVGYLFVPTIEEDRVAETYGNLKDLIQSLGGELISDEMPKMIGLSYSMTKVISNIRHKFNTAYFGWVKFEMEKGKIAELKNKLDLDNNVIRFLITKTVRENTMATKRFVSREGGMKRRPALYTKKEEEGAGQEINKEEIDKEIDALAAV
jgi:ribosomal protein S6